MADLNINLIVAAKDAASRQIGNIHSALGKVGDSARNAGQHMLDWGKKAAIAAGIGVAAIGALIIGKAIPAAADLNEQLSKNTVVFGENSQQIIDWSKTTASSLGISQTAALEATGTFGNLFRAIGIGTAPAADMSQQMVQLAGDLASFNNASPEEVLLALRAGLVGETEPLRRFGINLNDATLKQEALRMGLIKTTEGTLPPAIKAQAAYSLIMQQSSLAQGDFARTSDSVANQQRIFAATVEDSMAKIGQAFLPLAAEILPVLTSVITTVADTITNDIIPAIQSWFADNEKLISQIIDFVSGVLGTVATFIIDELVPAIASVIGAVGGWIEANKPFIDQVVAFATEVIPMIIDGIIGGIQFMLDTIGPIIDAVADVFGAVGEVFAEIAGDMGDEGIDLGAVLGTIFETLGAVISTVAGVIKTVLGGVADFIRNNKETIAGIIRGLAGTFEFVFGLISTIVGGVFGAAGEIGKMIGNVIGFFGNLVSFITGLPGKIANAARGMWDGIWQAFKGAINTVIRFWNNLGFTIGPIDLGPLGRVGPWTIGTPNIPYLAKGGFLPAGGLGIVGEAGPELIMAGRHGTTVQPFGAGTVVNGPLVAIEHFEGTEANIEELSRSLARYLRLEGTTPVRVFPD